MIPRPCYPSPELIGHDVNRCGEAPKDFDYLARYGQLVEQLLAL
ncbi:MAG: hypothetical protein ACJ76Y_11155 [Thermoanaerobaculia bacterium]